MHPSFLGTHKTRWQGDLGPILLPPTICKTPGERGGRQRMRWHWGMPCHRPQRMLLSRPPN